MKRIWIDFLDVNLKSALRNLKFAILLGAMLFAPCSFAEAQPQGKLPKIGWLSPGSVATTRMELFLREFRKLGYVEGKNIAIEARYAEDKLDRLHGLADELVRLKVDVLLTPGANGALALKNATRTIPIVFFGAVSDPVEVGLVDSLARPGGNVTGFHHYFGRVGGQTT